MVRPLGLATKPNQTFWLHRLGLVPS